MTKTFLLLLALAAPAAHAVECGTAAASSPGYSLVTCTPPHDCQRLAARTRWQAGRAVTYTAVGPEYIGRYRTQHIRTHRSARDSTVISSTTRRMWCTAGGWSSKP
jgi:hypothetical protein